MESTSGGERPPGHSTASQQGTDDLAGRTVPRNRRRRDAAESGAEEASTAGEGVASPPDADELDARDRLKSTRRKPAGPGPERPAAPAVAEPSSDTAPTEPL